MDRTNKMLLLIAVLLDRWDDLPNDVKSEPELVNVAKVVSEISELADDESDGDTSQDVLDEDEFPFDL